MKRIMLLLILASLFVACGNQKKEKKEAVADVVTVSILPQKTFVEKIAGDDFEVNVLIPPGSSPAAYTLLPSQLKDISRSAIWFRIGYIGFEHSWKDKIEQANTKMKVVNISEDLDLIADHIEQHGDHVHIDGIDPHVWLSPTLVKQMAKVILDELSALKPEKTNDYKANYMRFVKECDQLDVDLKKQLKDFEGKKFIVFHPSLSYYAREYGLEQFSLETGGKEPTPQQLREVVDMAKSEGIKVIYIQSEFDREHARVFADEIGGEIVEVWPLNPEWEENLRQMTQILTDNF
ncbi:zinc ABC transporter substrate-binding protein [Draconibacterium sp. IB214405]|uniref:metal ABC transporter solute-binding protein, Zn/Mn family n=1 Tax=Draconibacterium sp. IB214405 TaxID=3097352 RepID=UPI002A158F09|nr:zinc ABC transporter substrate-binding protein [Draconibacterium sp. IB214405]MDX8337666.1 zinc ABC transporter substrate-binding protein [Draconibacterium sp. IB214405]